MTGSECYHFNTYETPGDSESRRIIIPVVIFKAERTPVKNDPIMFLQGGPGPAYIGKDYIASTYKVLFYEYWSKDRDVIMADYRGLGISEPGLVCEQLDNESLQAVSSDDWFRVYQNCYEELKSAELDLSQYHAFNIVKDLISLRKQLSIKQWNLWGQSYGGLIAMLLADQDNAATRSIIVDSSSIPRFRSNRASNIEPFVSLLNDSFKACEELWRCAKFFPNASEEFASLIKKLDTEPIELRLTIKEQTYDVQITDDWFLSTVYNSMYKKRITEFLPDLVQSINEGDYEIFKKEFMKYFESTSLPIFSYGGFMTYFCFETELLNLDQINNLNVPDWVKKWKSSTDVCQIWKEENKACLFKDVSISFDNPILFLSGELDHVTPANWTEEILNDFKNGQRFVFPDKSHNITDVYRY